MAQDPPTYPDLRASLEVVLEAVGYRLPSGSTANAVAMRAFGCGTSGATRRLNGEYDVSPAEMSRLVVETTLARDGIVPEDFRNGPAALKSLLRERGVGLFGASAGSRLLRAVRDYAGERGVIEVRRRIRRSGGFVWGEKAQTAAPFQFLPFEPLYLACRGPEGFRLLLVDHAPDIGGPELLVPAVAGAWIEADGAGWTQFPGPDDPALQVQANTTVRQAIALWLRPTLAERIDGMMPDIQFGFRRIPETAQALILGSLRNGGPDSAGAVADVFYRAAMT